MVPLGRNAIMSGPCAGKTGGSALFSVRLESDCEPDSEPESD